MSIKKVELKRIPVVTVKEPVRRVAIPSSHMEMLRRSIEDKCEQNKLRYIKGYESASKFHVKDDKEQPKVKKLQNKFL